MPFKTITKTVKAETGADIGVSLSLEGNKFVVRYTCDDIEIGYVELEFAQAGLADMKHALQENDLDESEKLAAEKALQKAILALVL